MEKTNVGNDDVNIKVDKELWVLIGCHICIVVVDAVTCIRDGQTKSDGPVVRVILNTP
jgi:hypothetical protein